MSTELILMESDNKEMVMADLANIGDFSSVFVTSKDIAKETEKKHPDVIKDIKRILVNMLDGKNYVKTICTGGLAYSQYRNKNLDSLFKKLSKNMKNIDEANVLHEYFQGITWSTDKRGYVVEFTIRGDVAMHIITKYNDHVRWNMINYMKSLINENARLITQRTMQYVNLKPELTREEKFDIFFDINTQLADEHKKRRATGELLFEKPVKMIEEKTPLQICSNVEDSPEDLKFYEKEKFLQNATKRGKNSYKSRRNRILDALNIEEDKIYSLEWLTERFNTTEDCMRLFLVKHEYIKKNEYFDESTIPEGNTLRREWMIVNEVADWHDDYEQFVTVKYGTFTTQGIIMIYKFMIADAKKYKSTMNVRDRDYLPIGEDFKDFCSDYKFRI